MVPDKHRNTEESSMNHPLLAGRLGIAAIIVALGICYALIRWANTGFPGLW